MTGSEEEERMERETEVKSEKRERGKQRVRE